MAEIIQVKGLAELQAKLATLPAQLTKKILRRAVGAAAKQARDAARAAAPLGRVARKRGSGLVTPPGTLKRSAIVIYDRKQSNDTQAVFDVTFRKGKKQQKGNRDAFYASWVEFGHRVIARKGSGKGSAGVTFAFQRQRNGKVSLRGHAYSATSLLGRRRAGAIAQVEGIHYLARSFESARLRFINTIESEIRNGFDAAVSGK